jgi:hypothetical protein
VFLPEKQGKYDILQKMKTLCALSTKKTDKTQKTTEETKINISVFLFAIIR